MKKHTKETIIELIQILCILTVCICFILSGAAMDTCDHDALSILDTLKLIGLCAGGILAGGYIFCLLERFK